MKFINITRIIAILLLITIAGGIYTARQYLNRDLISEAQNAMRDSLARFLTPEIKALAKAQAATRILQEEETQRSVIFWGAVTRYGTVSTLTTLLTAVLMLSAGAWYKLTTHRLKTRYSEIEYRGKLDPAVATGLVLAEQLESRSSEAAVNLYLKLAETNTRQLSALAKGVHGPALTAGNSIPLENQTTPIGAAPTFAQLLSDGMIAPGKPLVIGYKKDNQPLQSTLDDNYSTVVFGQSGTGKTTGEAYSIASTVLSYGAHYTILDPHYPDKNKESLGDRLGALTSLDNIRIVNNPYRLDEYTAQLTGEFEAFLQTGTGKSPHIIVVDEHSVWKNASNGGKAWLKFEERIIYEGRKYGWYLHVTSKSPLAQDFGTSAVRDNFVTSLMYKVKKHQALTYYKDPELVEMVQACDKPGMAVYTDRQDVSQVVRIPMIQAEDMQTVVTMVRQGNGQSIVIDSQASQLDARRDETVSVSQHTGQDTGQDTAASTGEAQESQLFSDGELLQIIQAKRDEGESVSGMAKDIDFERSYFSKWLSGGKEITDVLRDKLQAYCQGFRLDTAASTGEAQEETQNNIINAATRFSKEGRS